MKNKINLFFAFAISLVLTGCSNTEKEKPFAPRLDVNTTCKIVVNGHYTDFEALDQQAEKFKEFYPNVDVHYEKIDNYAKESTFNDLFLGDSAPDIFFVNNGWENDPRYVKLYDYAEDLSDAELGINLSAVRDGLIYKDKDGRVPFVPIFTNSYGMVVNEEIFSKNKLSIPKTYSQLIHVCNQLIDAGYESPIISYEASTYSFYFPYFLSTINGNKEAVDALNTLDSSAGRYMKNSLEKAKDFDNYHFIDKNKCEEEITKDDSTTIPLRFYKGDIPMLFTEVNRFSGSHKREAQSEEYKEHPFKYSFQPIPSDNTSGYYYNTVALSFAVNKESKNLAMTNEFMRFIISSRGLNEMNASKRQISPAKVLSENKLYNSFKDVLKQNRVLYYHVIGLSADADMQARKTFLALLDGASVEDAMAGYGSY